MLIQSIKFKKTENSQWEDGVARVKEFGLSDVEWIVDKEGQLMEMV